MTMSEGCVLISTHNLPVAGELRTRFEEVGYETDLVTPTEKITGSDVPTVLVVTGRDDSGKSMLAKYAKDELHIPVFALEPVVDGEQSLECFDEVFNETGDLDDVVLLCRRAIERQRLRSLTGIVGQTDAMRQVLERVVQIAPVSSTVLVTGESGTGKELVARGIHALSPRRHKPFIGVNVAALSETLLESELFGHEKGAFTGAIDSRKGLFELADGGTIFLDELGEMPLATQTKLLRVLEQREFHRVGGEIAINVDVRILAATNQDLRQLVSIGEFRRDLYFRLNVLGIELPALRERREDIPLLIEEFVRDVSDQNDQSFPGISPDAMQILVDYNWPGNIRELRNLVESMVVLAPRRIIRPEDLPEEVRGGKISLLPVALRQSEDVAARVGSSVRPELEFVFRTLVELRVDMDDLRRDFEAYRGGIAEGELTEALLGSVGTQGGPMSAGIEIPAYVPGVVEPVVKDELEDREVVVYRHGMTIHDMESAAIGAALREVSGNRRKAAELLGIGERTLYRKISRYGLDP